MNYLAHLALSNQIEEVMVGNMIEDFITGRIEHPRNNFLTHNIRIGVLLHRQIDTFTDTDLDVKKGKELFYASVGKYSSVVLDVYFDHFLIKNWEKYYKISIDKFCENVYEVLPRYSEYYPPNLKKLVLSMTDYHWLTNYEHDWGLERALQSVESKINQKGFLTESMKDFHKNYDLLDTIFTTFYLNLIEFSNQFLANNPLK